MSHSRTDGVTAAETTEDERPLDLARSTNHLMDSHPFHTTSLETWIPHDLGVEDGCRRHQISRTLVADGRGGAAQAMTGGTSGSRSKLSGTV